MHCFVYRCVRRPETYLYLSQRDAFDCVPQPLRDQLGVVEFVVEFSLQNRERLGREDPQVVRRNLAALGFHVQFPPSDSLAAHAVD